MPDAVLQSMGLCAPGMGAFSLNPFACTTYVDPNTGSVIDCDSISNFFNSTCWGLTSAACAPAGSTIGESAADVAAANPGLVTSAGTPIVQANPSSVNPLCSVLSCDSGGNIQLLDSTTIAWLGAGLLAVWFLFNVVVGAGGRR